MRAARPSSSMRRRAIASLVGSGMLLLQVGDDVTRLLAEAFVVDLLRVDERAAHHRDRTHHARLGDLLVGRAEQALGLRVEERAVAAACGARERDPDELFVLVRNLRLFQPEVARRAPEALEASLGHLLYPLRDEAERLLDLSVDFLTCLHA